MEPTVLEARRKLQKYFDGKVSPRMSLYIGHEWERIMKAFPNDGKQAMLFVDDLIEKLGL